MFAEAWRYRCCLHGVKKHAFDVAVFLAVVGLPKLLTPKNPWQWLIEKGSPLVFSGCPTFETHHFEQRRGMR